MTVRFIFWEVLDHKETAMVTIFSEAKYGTWSLTSKSADLVINGTDWLQLALPQKCRDLATVETARARGLAD